MSVILIIDDSPTELHLFQNMLEKSGFETLVADSGEEGVRQAEVSRPDCILMDVVMPGMNGFPGDAKTDPGSTDVEYSRHHDYNQGSGDRQDLGHAPGRRRIHRQADRAKGSCCQDQCGNG